MSVVEAFGPGLAMEVLSILIVCWVIKHLNLCVGGHLLAKFTQIWCPYSFLLAGSRGAAPGKIRVLGLTAAIFPHKNSGFPA